MARKEKVTESTSTLEAQRPESDAPQFETAGETDSAMQLVEEPGPVKKIHFDGSPVFVPSAPEPEAAAAPAGEGSYRMAEVGEGRQSPALTEQSDSIYTIRDEVDQLNAPDARFTGAPKRANLSPWRSSTVYRTDQGGEVRAHEGPTGKSFTLSDGRQERRFNSSEVDRVIEGINLEERSTVSETVPESASPEPTTQEEPKARRGLFGFRGRKKGKVEVAEAPTEAPAATEYQPQCPAITEEGLQCRNSARDGSKYCSSHFGFQPRTTQGIHQSRDTEPRYESSRDTLPGGGWEPGASAQTSAQCTAVTKGGKQCQNPIVAGSPYCGSHQGYSEPSAAEIVKSVDTKPRWAKAKDTKPATRKPAKSAKSSKSSSSKSRRK